MKDLEIKISCIIPVYNCARYLNEFMESMLQQTFDSFEMVMVDDASSDESLEILTNYAKQDERIKVYTLGTNVGAANARNYGLNISCGEYVIFLDADDICEYEMLERAYSCCMEYDADVCYFDMDTFQDGEFYTREILKLVKRLKKSVDTYPILEGPHSANSLFRNIHGGPCNKLVNKKILNENSILFQDIPNAEDVYYSHMVCFFARKIVFCDVVLYHYRRGHCESTTTQMKEGYRACAIEAIYNSLYDGHFYKESNGFLIDKIETTYQLYHNRSNIPDRVRRSLKVFGNVNLSGDGTLSCRKSKFYKELVDRILLCDFRESYADISWKYYRNNLLSSIQEAILQKRNIAIWGAGIRGKTLLKKLKEERICIYCFIDNDETLQGTLIEDVPVRNYNEVKTVVELILVTNSAWIDDINKQINYSKETIDVMGILNVDA